MKRTRPLKKTPLPKDLQRAIDLFPSIVRKNRVESRKKMLFIEKTFGKLAREVHKQVHGKKR